MKRHSIIAFAVGLVFAIGLGIAGMTSPARIAGFLDLANWDLTLAFVMVGAIAVHAVCYRLIRRRSTPLFANLFDVPTASGMSTISPKLMIGAVVFGIGWGLGGFCPGPGIVAIASGSASSVIFVATMIAGMAMTRYFSKPPSKSPSKRWSV